MKIQILGASCAGSTTLGKALAERLGVPYFDTDEYFWEPTEVSYTVKRDTELRDQMLLNDMAGHESWVMGGSVIKWGEVFRNLFDLVIFLYIPGDIRMQRLHTRELQRYGDAIYNDPVRSQLYKNFVAWAAEYDNTEFSGRNVKAHRNWLQLVSGEKMEIVGDTTVEERVQLVMEKIKHMA